MRDRVPSEDPLLSHLKHFIVDTLELHDVKAQQITDDEPLIGGRIRLDSLDALELTMCLEEEFGITIRSRDEGRVALASIASLADFIRTNELEKMGSGLTAGEERGARLWRKWGQV